MSKNMIVRAWKDAQFRASLSPAQLAEVGPHPSGGRIERARRGRAARNCGRPGRRRAYAYFGM
ncbi:MAG: mersacidin/lichenicidin family type 2 lantibiotic [Egibacteraceae bacterium]